MPVYPKENPEHRQKVLERFYKTVRETNWGADEEQVCKPRGRKAKPRVIAEQTLRSKKEIKQLQPIKFFNFH
jgi:tRNA1(Val) A37 N6-methylase TrmN6